MNNTKVAKLFEVSTGHRLSDYAGKCRHWHGHNYIGELVVEGDELDSLGMLIDFGDMKEVIKKHIDKKFDHLFILKRGDPFNEAMGKTAKDYEPEDDSSFVWVDYNPTVENIIQDMKQIAESYITVGKIIIRLSETSTSYAETT